MPACQNRDFIWMSLLILQHLMYLTARAFDDVSWYNVGITVGTLETISTCFMTGSVALKIIRKHCY